METERCLFETKDLLIVPDAPCPERDACWKRRIDRG